MYLATIASITLGTGAAEGLQGILTDSSVETGLGVTLIDLILAVGTSEARATSTGIAIDFVCARPSIEARAVDIFYNLNIHILLSYSVIT